MKQLTKSTQSISGKDISRNWHLIDIKGKMLGRAVSQISSLLQGKHKVYYSPNADMGDYVVVINAQQILLSGKKAANKVYKRYSGYPGGLRTVPYKEMIINKPQETIIHAVSGMLPKNKLRAKRLTRLYVYPADKHPYETKFKTQNSNGKS